MNIIDIDNLTDLNIEIELLEQIAAYLTSREIELIITDNEHITKLNKEHRDKEKATDVLSFPIDLPFENCNPEHTPLGSIVVSKEFIESKASMFKHSKQDELSLLFIHGLLHLLGYDHELDSGEMRDKEHEVIKHFSLPSSLIIRTEDI